MQQYRVNYRLLIGLAIGFVVASVAVYGLHSFQINRNAKALLVEAAKAEESGNHQDAADAYSNYLSIRPEDDAVRVKFANAWGDVTEESDVTPEEYGKGVQVMEETVRTLPDEKTLQKRLVDMYVKMQRYQDAIDHLSYMLAKYPDEADLQVLRTESLAHVGSNTEAMNSAFKLIGYDEKADAFDVKKAIAPNNASSYTTAATLARSQLHKPDVADQIMDQAIKVNPDSAEAFLARGRYRVVFDQAEKGQRDIEKAYKLKPDDADVLLAMADRAQNDKKLDQAAQYLTTGKKKYPDDPRFYQALAGMAMQNEKYDDALDIVNEGLKAVPGQKGQGLLLVKADLLFLDNKIADVKDTMEAMRKSHFRTELIDFQDARVLLAQGKWNDAAKALLRLRPKLGDLGGLGPQMDIQLAVCYEKMGKLDEAKKSYNLVLQQDPSNQRALAGKQRIDAVLHPPSVSTSGTQGLEKRVQEMLAKPKAEQNWQEIDKQMDQLADTLKLEGVSRDLFWENLNMMREDYAAARRNLVDARNKDPKDIRVQLAAIQLLQRDPSAGPDKAMQLLDKVTAQFGDHSAERLLRADILIAQKSKSLKEQSDKQSADLDASTIPNVDDLRGQLAKLAEGIDDWGKDEKIELWNGLAARFIAIGAREEATAYWNKVADLRPDELPTRLTLFGIALEAGDDAAMRDVQQKILDLVGSKNDSTWLYTEARRQMSLVRRGDLGKESLADIRQLTDKALQQRSDWFELHLVKAELEMLDGKDDKALEEFEKAEQLGRVSPAGVTQHVRLLLNRGQETRRAVARRHA
jgi:tetratricopeptide (TPR) repeat protein